MANGRQTQRKQVVKIKKLLFELLIFLNKARVFDFWYNHRIKKYGFEGALGKVQGLFNKDLEYKPLDENMEEKIISQTVNKRLETALPDEVLNKDIEIITKEGKLYYSK